MTDGGIEQIHDCDDNVGRIQRDAVDFDGKQIASVDELEDPSDETQTVREMEELEVFAGGER